MSAEFDDLFGGGGGVGSGDDMDGLLQLDGGAGDPFAADDMGGLLQLGGGAGGPLAAVPAPDPWPDKPGRGKRAGQAGAAARLAHVEGFRGLLSSAAVWRGLEGSCGCGQCRTALEKVYGPAGALRGSFERGVMEWRGRFWPAGNQSATRPPRLRAMAGAMVWSGGGAHFAAHLGRAKVLCCPALFKGWVASCPQVFSRLGASLPRDGLDACLRAPDGRSGNRRSDGHRGAGAAAFQGGHHLGSAVRMGGVVSVGPVEQRSHELDCP